MAPAAAAADWLTLVDEAIAVPHRSFSGALGGGGMPEPIGSLSTVMLDLPGPNVWPEIRALVDKRPPSPDRTALQILCARLLGDDEGVIRYCEEFERTAPPPRDPWPWPPTLGIRLAALLRQGRLRGRTEIEQWLEHPHGVRRGLMPDLRDLLPLETVRTMTFESLKSSASNKGYSSGFDSTLARELVLSHLNEFKKPLWEHARDLNDIGYVQRLIDHYGYADLVDPQLGSESAQKIYFRWLVLHHKLDEAARLLQDVAKSPAISAQEWGPGVKDVDREIETLQARVPNRDLWDLYTGAAIACGHIHEAAGRIGQHIRAASMKTKERSALIGQLMSLLEMIGDLDGLVADCRLAKQFGLEKDALYGILAIGLAAGDQRLIELGLTHDRSGDRAWNDDSLVRVQMERGQFADIERADLEDLRQRWSEHGSVEISLGALCDLYYRANRPKDILDLLQEFPAWPQDSLAKLDHAGFPHDSDSYDSQPIGFYAAWAFARTGRKDLAIKTLRDLLLYGQGAPVYELLNRIAGASALPIYDVATSANSVDPVPCLWKADLLFRLGHIGEAETGVRRAIALNPNQSFPYRRKLNDLLGKILLKKGDRAGARRCARLVKALDVAARCEESPGFGSLERNPLISQCAADLEKALAIYPDDATLQADLASCLHGLCRYGEAKKHYLAALRLAPFSLGEDSYEAPGIDSIASETDEGRKVLDSVVRQNPRNAEAYYARGLMLEKLGHSKEAVADFERTVALDPNHFMAWRRLSESTLLAYEAPARSQDAELRMIEFGIVDDRYDIMIDLTTVTDLRTAYVDLRRSLARLPKPGPDPIFSLPCQPDSGKQIDWPKFDPRGPTGRFIGGYFRYSSDLYEIVALFHPTDYPYD